MCALRSAATAACRERGSVASKHASERESSFSENVLYFLHKRVQILSLSEEGLRPDTRDEVLATGRGDPLQREPRRNKKGHG
jgi:hypothetical protein